MADLKKIGLILVLIDGIFTLVAGVMGLIGSSLDLGFDTGTAPLVALDGTVYSIVLIVVGILLIMFFTEKINVGTDLILAIVLIVIAVVLPGAGFLTLLGGVLVLIDAVT